MSESELQGLLCIGDPHLASRAPGFRKDDYPRTILGKLRWVLTYAEQNRLVPVILGDLFHFPRDNANWLLVQVLELLNRPVLAVAGNHDCSTDTLSDDDTLCVLCAAGKVHLLDRQGEWRGAINGTRVCIGGTSWGRTLPQRFERGDAELVVWVAHHDVRFPGYEAAARIGCCEIPGVDVVVNGHIHRPMEDVVRGRTTWINPGNISRVRRDDNTRQHVPGALRIDIAAAQWSKRMVEIPHLPFEQVFHQDVAPADVRLDDSLFIRGLAQLESRKTAGGAGLMAFLKENVRQFPEAVAAEVLALAKEVTDGESEHA